MRRYISVNTPTENKQVIRDFIQTVWISHNLAALPRFWTTDCVNHAMPGEQNHGLDALQAYHQEFMQQFAAFSSVHIELLQQIAENDRVVTHTLTHGRHTGLFAGIAPSGKTVSLFTIRIDRIEDGKIVEHWSVADLAGLMQQLGT